MSNKEGEMSDEGGEVLIIQNLDSWEVFPVGQNIPEPNVPLVPEEAVEVLLKEQEKSLEVLDAGSQVREAQSNSFKTDFLEFLKKDTDGKLVFAHFQHHKCLDKESRGTLTRTIIKKFQNEALKNVAVGEKLADFSISNKILTAISQSIAEIFPGEDATIFFSPYRSENGISFQKGGTLWANLCYVKEQMRKKGVLAKPKPSLQKTDEDPVFVREDESSAKALQDLENTLNTDTLIEDWRLTYNRRKNLLAIDKLPINDYISRFPCLQTQDAIKLFELDFVIGNPEKSGLLRARWSVIKQVLIQQLEAVAQKLAKRKRNALSLDDLVLIKLLPTLESDSQDAIVLYLLQLLIGTAGCGGKRKKGEPVEVNSKYQPTEIRDSFVYRVEKTEDIEDELEGLKQKLLARKDTLQPLILVTGPWTKIEESFVIVNNLTYKVPSCLDALDSTLKILFALDCSYPRASLRLWQFVQHAGFDIVLPGESLIKSVKELLSVTKQALRQAGLIQPQ